MDVKRYQQQLSRLRACTNCLCLVEKNESDRCPNCDGHEFDEFSGFVGILDPPKSYVQRLVGSKTHSKSERAAGMYGVEIDVNEPDDE